MMAAEVQPLDQRRHADNVEPMTTHQYEAHEISESIGEREDLRRQTAFGTAGGLALSRPLRPGRGDGPRRWWRRLWRIPCLVHPNRACKKPDEGVGFDPVAVRLKDRVPLAKDLRKITPRAAGPIDP